MTEGLTIEKLKRAKELLQQNHVPSEVWITSVIGDLKEKEIVLFETKCLRITKTVVVFNGEKQ